ncbi:TPA: hypothetical protein ACH3X1_014540 [Trebouxia sp. C0004]
MLLDVVETEAGVEEGYMLVAAIMAAATVSEEDDEILATEYISSREALTLVWPIRRVGRKWGCLIPSPFDDSCTSRDLDEKEAELKSLEEAASAVGSELDPSVTIITKLLMTIG